jgi:hypothetical protein
MTGKQARIAGWSVAAVLIALPGIAMLFTDEVRWGAGDFVFWGALLAGAGILLEITVRNKPDRTYRLAMGVALVTTFLLMWMAAAVGILDGADWVLGGVFVVGLLGAALSGFRAAGMARALAAVALTQIVVAALARGTGLTPVPPLKIAGLTAFFVALWLLSAWLFRRAARGEKAIRAGGS